MTFPTRRTLGVSVVGAVLLVGLMLALNGEPGQTGAVPSPRAADRGAVPGDAGDAPVANVRLEALQRTRPDLERAQRNLFRFQARPALPGPRSAPPATPTEPAPLVAGPSGPPPPPPIPVKFIGLVDTQSPTGQVVFFSDGRGHVFSAREGDTIEGRYKVLKVSADAAELSYLDGRGRQTIRLSGQ